MKVFISWSKKNSEEIAKEMISWLDKLFTTEVTFFISSEIKGGKTWFNEIVSELKNSEVGVLVLTPENINSPWLLFEAGALCASTNKKMIPVLFGRDLGRIESVFKNVTCRSFNKEHFLEILETINECIEAKLDKVELKNHMDESWVEFEKKVKPLIEKAIGGLPAKHWQGLATSKQQGVGLSVAKVFGIENRNDYGTNLLVKDIPERLEAYVIDNLEEDYCVQDGNNHNDRIFIINNTRVTTFIAFTDGEKIALLNRKDNFSEIETVKNKKLDVFGSIHFSNRNMLRLKITNEDFHDARVMDIQEIPGFAYEDNQSEELEKETVVMIGYAVKVESDDLNNILNSKTKSDSADIALYDIQEIPDSLTAKAKLAFDFLNRAYLLKARA